MATITTKVTIPSPVLLSIRPARTPAPAATRVPFK